MQIVNNNLAKAEHIPLSTPKNLGGDNAHQENNQNRPNDNLEKLKLAETKLPQIINTLDKKVMPLTAFGSAMINFISAPIRLFEDDNPLKKLINNISMLGTKLHLALYGAIGMWTAHEHKNPLLLFSFAVECLSSLFDLRKIYLFRGIATGIDGAVGAFKDRYEQRNPDKDFKHKNYSEGLSTNLKLFKEILSELKANPKSLIELKGAPTLIASSILMVAGSIFGLTINDKIGASIRDIFGGFNDFGLTQLENKTARKSGGFYLLGTFKDLLARFFTADNAKLFGVTEIAKFERGRDALHELALGFDRIGQYYFLRFNQEGNANDEKIKERKNIERELHQAQILSEAMAA
jgi:hypothetical protein